MYNNLFILNVKMLKSVLCVYYAFVTQKTVN